MKSGTDMKESEGIGKLPCLSLAPMEGVTGWKYRRLLNSEFGHADRFYTPFITPAERIGRSSRFGREIDPAHNEGMTVIPQILTNDAEGFIETAKLLKELGYREVNLNLGCPSGTVVRKGRGSGFLEYPWELDRFLEKIISGSPLPVSVKTRIGVRSPEEFGELVGIFARYPFTELIIHPRVREEMYTGYPHSEAFSEACERISVPLVYNGNVNSPRDAYAVLSRFPSVAGIMLGRGAIARPDLFRELKTGKQASPAEMLLFHDKLYDLYREELGEKDVLFKFKELWSFMRFAYPDPEEVWNRIRRSKTNAEYRTAARDILGTERTAYAEGPGF